MYIVSFYFTFFFKQNAKLMLYHLDLTLSFHLLKKNYSVESRTRNYWNAGIATLPLGHGGSGKGNTCIGHIMNIYFVQQTCANYADWQRLHYRPYSIDIINREILPSPVDARICFTFLTTTKDFSGIHRLIILINNDYL